MRNLSKKNKVILVLITISSILIFGALTYAFFSAGGVTNNATDANVVTLTSNYGNVIVNYLNGNNINTENVLLKENAGDFNEFLKFSVYNSGTTDHSVIIRWDNLTNNFCHYQREGICTNVATDIDVQNELNYTLYECDFRKRLFNCSSRRTRKL